MDDSPKEPSGAFHRLRQSGVDEELFDVVFNFEGVVVEEQQCALA